MEWRRQIWWYLFLILALLGGPSCSDGQGGDESLDTVEQATTGQACNSTPLAGECRYFPIEASASSSENNNYPAQKAIDGDCSTRWSSAFSDPQWLKLDLGSRRKLSRVVIRWEAAASADYKLQVSDNGSVWTTIATDENASKTGSGSSRVDTLSGLVASARYVRIFSLARTSSYGNSIFEFEVFGTDCGMSDGCSQIPVFPLSATASSSENSSKTADKAIDGLSSTRWSSAFSDPQWIRLDLGSSQSIGRVVLDWENATSSKYEIQVSESSSGPWTVVHTHTDGTVGPRTDDISGLNGQGRFLRIHSTKRATSYGNSIYEIRLFRRACDKCEQTLVPSSVRASSTESNAFPASKAVDGNYSTRWSSQFSDPQWLELDFGAERSIKQVIVNWQHSASKSYRLEVAPSSSGPWMVLAERTNQGLGPRVDEITNLNGVGRFLRIYSTARTTSYGNSIYEVLVLGNPNPLACGNNPPAAASASNIQILLPKGVDPSAVALGGSHAVTVGSLASVGSLDSLVTSALDGVLLGSGSQVEGVTAKGNVTLGEGSTAAGDVSTEGDVQLGAGASVAGTINDSAVLSPPDTLSWPITVPGDANRLGDTLVHSGREKILFPNGYGNLTAETGSKVYLQSGTYFFRSVSFAQDAQLVLESAAGLVQIYIESSFSFAGAVSGLGGDKPQLLVGYLGSQPASLGGTFVGTFAAPSSSVTVAGTLRGSVFAHSIHLEDGATVEHQAAPWDFITGKRSPDTVTIELGKSPVILDASHRHSPVEEFVTGTATPPSPVECKIPGKLLVGEGNAGNKPATLTVVTPGGETVVCTYRGGSSVPHPEDPLEIAKGREYLFESCSNGFVAGSSAVGSSFTLDVQGDELGIGQETSVRLSCGDGCDEVLGQPISPAESVAMVQGFNWSNTQPVAELTADGLPTLYYANIYVRSQAEIDLLDKFRIHWEKRPIFDNELQAFGGHCGTFSYEGDGEGLFVFAVIPGPTYNRIRAAVFNSDIRPEQRVMFKAIVLRQAPDAITDDDGSLNYQMLIDAGFQYLGVRDLPSDEALDETQLPGGGATAAWIDAVEFVSNVANDAAQLVTEAIGALDRLLQGSVTITVNVDVFNRDPRFDGLLTRGWGPGGGSPIRIHGAKVEVLQWAQRIYTLGVPLPSKFRGRTDANGRTRIEVAKGGDGIGGSTSSRGSSGLCIELKNAAARVTSFLIADDVCDIPVINVDNPTSSNSPYGDFTEDREVAISTTNVDLVALSEITDSYDYYTQVVGGEYVQPRVLRGFNASVLSFGSDRLWVPCFGRRNAVVDTAVVAAFGIGGPALAFYVGVVGTSDYIIPQGSSLETTRGIMTHESGHYALCNLIGQSDPDFSFFTNLTIDSMTEEFDGELDVENTARIINESFADFFAGQVVSGANYFTLPNTNQNTGKVDFCRLGNCWDSNQASETSTAKTRLEKIATTIHDAFDGHGKGVLAPTDGDAWEEINVVVDATGNVTSSDILFTPAAYGDAGDESVVMGGPRLQDFVAGFVERTGGAVDFDIEDYESGLVDAIALDHTWCQACELFAQHEAGLDGAAVRNLWNACTTNDRLFFLLGPQPEAFLRLDAATCQVCGDHAISDDSGVCQECADREVRQGNSCNACPTGTIQVNNQCVNCTDTQITVGNQCVSCPAGQRADRATNTCADCPADIVIDGGMIQSTGVGVVVSQSTSQAANDLCPDVFWVQIINLDPSGESLGVAGDIETELSGAACQSSNLSVALFEIGGTTWGMTEFDSAPGLPCEGTGTVCPDGSCGYATATGGVGLPIDPGTVSATTVRVRGIGTQGTSGTPVILSVGRAGEVPPPTK